jgi:ABC-2 type transport system ATP-binding protein
MSGLDPEQRANLRGMIRELAGSASVLVTTHILQDIPELADRVVVLADGVIRFDGSAEEFGTRADRSASTTEALEAAYRAVISDGSVPE